jgi:hypothetical protein
MPNRYWAEALSHAMYLINATPTKANVDGLLPYHAWHGQSPPAHSLRVFGAHGTMVVPGRHKTKLQTCTVDVWFLGNHPTLTATYQVLIMATGCIMHLCNVVFSELIAATVATTLLAPPDHRRVFDPLQYDHSVIFPQLFDPSSMADRGEHETSTIVSSDIIPSDIISSDIIPSDFIHTDSPVTPPPLIKT